MVGILAQILQNGVELVHISTMADAIISTHPLIYRNISVITQMLVEFKPCFLQRPADTERGGKTTGLVTLKVRRHVDVRIFLLHLMDGLLECCKRH